MDVLTMSGMLVDLLVWLHGYICTFSLEYQGDLEGIYWVALYRNTWKAEWSSQYTKNSKHGEIYLMIFLGSVHFSGQMLEAQAKV